MASSFSDLNDYNVMVFFSFPEFYLVTKKWLIPKNENK